MRAEWSNKLRDLRRIANLSQVQLASRLGVTKKTVAEWEQSRQPPSPERLLQLARMAPPGPLRTWFIRSALERVGADAPLVLDALLPERAGRSQAPVPPTELRVITPADWSERFRTWQGLDPYASVPLLRDEAAAGTPRSISEADVEGYVLLPKQWCAKPEELTCVRVRGDSMVPILYDGALVGIDHSQRDPASLHQKMVAARYDEGVTVKWLERLPDGRLRLVPENKSHRVVLLPRSARNPIIGLVCWWWNRQR